MMQNVSFSDERGTYLLVLELYRRKTIRIGRLGNIVFSPGGYVYIGSAFGPGGLRARVGRHLSGYGARRWHVDYPRASADGVFALASPHRREHRWAKRLLAQAGVRPAVPRFGASDCNCPTHLFYARRTPPQAVLESMLGDKLVKNGG